MDTRKPQGMQTGINMLDHDHPVDKTKIDMTPLVNQPNDPYSEMSEEQMRNVDKHASMHFHFPSFSNYPMDKRFYKDRYVNATSQHLLRGIPLSQPYDWVDYQWSRHPPHDHNTCRTGASVRWGPQKTGQRTVGHTAYGEKVDSFTKIDVYRRAPTNMPGPVYMDCGRPGQGYPLCRNPDTNTWFGSSHKLNQTQILQTILPKTKAEYTMQREYTQNTTRDSKWPTYSEYTDRYLMDTKAEPRLHNLDARKKHLATAMAEVNV